MLKGKLKVESKTTPETVTVNVVLGPEAHNVYMIFARSGSKCSFFCILRLNPVQEKRFRAAMLCGLSSCTHLVASLDKPPTESSGRQ